jgi:hypothetical protein
MGLLNFFDRFPSKSQAVTGGSVSIVYNDPTEIVNIDDDEYEIVEVDD